MTRKNQILDILFKSVGHSYSYFKKTASDGLGYTVFYWEVKAGQTLEGFLVDECDILEENVTKAVSKIKAEPKNSSIALITEDELPSYGESSEDEKTEKTSETPAINSSHIFYLKDEEYESLKSVTVDEEGSSELKVPSETSDGVAALKAAVTATYGDTSPDIYPPVSDLKVNSLPNTNKRPNHNGYDLGTNGTNFGIFAVAKGEVVLSELSVTFGNWVVVDHGKYSNKERVYSVYGHLAEKGKEVGAVLEAGEQLGTMGDTGNRSKGIHLHIEIFHAEGFAGSRKDTFTMNYEDM